MLDAASAFLFGDWRSQSHYFPPFLGDGFLPDAGFAGSTAATGGNGGKGMIGGGSGFGGGFAR
jgi:hypothetical protein